jgi:uncharacterized protein YeaO (DUF488 family)
VRTKRVAEPATPEDGIRVLVMRLWPRGVRKTAADQWLKGLGTPLDLIRRWKAGKVPWEGLEREYRRHLRTAEARADLATLTALARQGRVTLLCTCPDETRCHRGILKRQLLATLRKS